MCNGIVDIRNNRLFQPTFYFQKIKAKREMERTSFDDDGFIIKNEHLASLKW